MAPDSNLSESEDDLNNGNGLGQSVSDDEDTMMADEVASSRKAAAAVGPDQILSFVRRLAREGPRQLTSSESDLAKTIVAIRKKWPSGVQTKQALSRTRRRAALSGAIPHAAILEDAEGKPRKRRMPSRMLPDLDSGPSELIYKGSVLEILPQRKKVDALLSSVAAFFHQPNKIGVPPGMERYIMPDQDRLCYSTLDALLSPLRKQSVWETWSPIQLALFEAGIYTLGKNFHEIAKLIDNKTTGDIVNLYYHWKQSTHYNMWKSLGKPIVSQTASSPSPTSKSNSGPAASLSARQNGQDAANL